MTKYTEFNFKYPRKKKKQLKKLGQWPKKGFVLEIDNNVTADIKMEIFDSQKYKQ